MNNNCCPKDTYPCNNPDTVAITHNPDYNIYYNKSNCTVYLKGIQHHHTKVIKLNNNINVEDNQCHDHHHHHSESSSNHSDSSSSENHNVIINSELFKFLGIFNSVNELNRIRDPIDTSIALIKVCQNGTINYTIYMYSTKKINNLTIGWNILSVLFNTINTPNNDNQNKIYNGTLIDPKLLKNNSLFDSAKFKNRSGSLYLPNIYYFITFENVAVNLEKTSNNDYYKIPKDGTYIVEYNISWFFSNIANNRFKQRICSITSSDTQETSEKTNSSNSSVDDILEEANNGGIMILIANVRCENIEIIYSSIKKQKGYVFPSNTSHQFKHTFNKHDKILMMAYNLHDKKNIYFNIFHDDTFINIKQIL